MPKPARIGVLAVLPAVAALLAGCGEAPHAARNTPPPTPPATPAARTTAPSPTPTKAAPPPPPSIGSAKDGRNLYACKDGECEVVVEPGDVLRFGEKVAAKPTLTPLTILSVGSRGLVFTLPKGMTTTASGTIELNDAISIETGHRKGHRMPIRITRLK